MELTPAQIRVLGCLVEKEAATPDGYPLTTNSLLLACNQRSSRDPVVDYDERTVTATMTSLRERGLARTFRGEGSRVYKHAHALRETLGLDAAELAVLSVLMLRGAQTGGELRTRTERQHGFASIDEVEAVLRALAARDPPLVAQRSRATGQKETRWTMLLGAEENPDPARIPITPSSTAEDVEAIASLREEIARLRDRIEALEARASASGPG